MFFTAVLLQFDGISWQFIVGSEIAADMETGSAAVCSCLVNKNMKSFYMCVCGVCAKRNNETCLVQTCNMK